MKRLLKVAGSGLAALIVLELILRLVLPAGPFFSTWPPGYRTVNRPDTTILPGLHGLARVSANSFGERGDEPSKDADGQYRVLVLGSSTTEMQYIDDDSTWAHLLQVGLGHSEGGKPVWVGTVGRSRHNARDNAVQLKYTIVQGPKLHAVVVMGGINDLTISLIAQPYPMPRSIAAPGSEREQIPLAFSEIAGWGKDVPAEGAAWKRAIRRTATVEAFRRLWHFAGSRLRKNHDDHGHERIALRRSRAQASAILDTLPDLSGPLIEYHRNLDRIVDLACASGIRTVFVTHPTIWHEGMSTYEQSLIWLGGTRPRAGPRPYYSVRAMMEALGKFNGVVMEVCRSRGVECIDIVPGFPHDTTAFYDDAHFNVHGGRIVSSLITNYLKAHWDTAAPKCSGRTTAFLHRTLEEG